jgi:hypothetical protein
MEHGKNFLQDCAAKTWSARWFKYERDELCVNKLQFVPVIFEPPCTSLAKHERTWTWGVKVAVEEAECKGVELVNVTQDVDRCYSTFRVPPDIFSL